MPTVISQAAANNGGTGGTTITWTFNGASQLQVGDRVVCFWYGYDGTAGVQCSSIALTNEPNGSIIGPNPNTGIDSSDIHGIVCTSAATVQENKTVTLTLAGPPGVTIYGHAMQVRGLDDTTSDAETFEFISEAGPAAQVTLTGVSESAFICSVCGNDTGIGPGANYTETTPSLTDTFFFVIGQFDEDSGAAGDILVNHSAPSTTVGMLAAAFAGPSAAGPTVDSITPNTPTSATHPAGGSVQVSGAPGGLAYWCHAPTSAGALTEAQIRDGDGGTYPFGTIPLSGDPATEPLPLVTGLSPSTSYTWHIFGEEAGPGASGEIATQAYSTAGAPFVSSIVPGTVSETALLTSQATLSLDLTGGNGTYWAAVYPSGATPSHTDIKAGTGAIGAVQTGALDSDPDTVVFSAFGGLDSNTPYLLFVTAEDAVLTPSVPDSAAFATENAQPNITNWQVTAVNTTTADFTITATDDEPNVEYCIAAYPQSSVVSDADLVADCRNAPAGGGVPSPNPRGALWAVSQTQTQGTAYVDSIELLVGNTTYEVEHAAVDASNTTRGANTNITTGFRTCTQAQPWKNADGTDIGVRSNWTWGWIDRDGSPQAGDTVTDVGTVDTDALGNWSSAVQLVNAATADGQFGTFLMFFNDTTSGRLRMQFYRYQVSVTPGTVN